MESHRWVKLPPNFFQECIVEALLGPIVDAVQEFFFTSNEVWAIIEANYGWDAPMGTKQFNSHYAATRVHARHHLEVD